MTPDPHVQILRERAEQLLKRGFHVTDLEAAEVIRDLLAALDAPQGEWQAEAIRTFRMELEMTPIITSETPGPFVACRREDVARVLAKLEAAFTGQPPEPPQ